MDGYGPEQARIYYYHLDHLGTPQELTNAQGKLVWSVTYRAYGNVVQQQVAEIDNPLRFQGQYHDPETGLHYNRHRYYNPNTGRFQTPDPIGLAGGLNNYQYVPNPTGWVDPLGLAVEQKNGPDSQQQMGSTGLELPDGPLDWDAVVPKKGKYKGQSRVDHVRLHNLDNPSKPRHGVFYGDGVELTNEAWARAQALRLKMSEDGVVKVPMNRMTGRSGGLVSRLGNPFIYCQ